MLDDPTERDQHADELDAMTDHIPAHESGPTWCERSGTFDVYFAGTPCRDVAEEDAFWRSTRIPEAGTMRVRYVDSPGGLVRTIDSEDLDM